MVKFVNVFSQLKNIKMNTKKAERYLETLCISKDEVVYARETDEIPVNCIMTDFFESETTTFEQCAKIMMKFLAKNKTPHTRVIIDCTSAELLEGCQVVNTEEFLKD